MLGQKEALPSLLTKATCGEFDQGVRTAHLLSEQLTFTGKRCWEVACHVQACCGGQAT